MQGYTVLQSGKVLHSITLQSVRMFYICYGVPVLQKTLLDYKLKLELAPLSPVPPT